MTLTIEEHAPQKRNSRNCQLVYCNKNVTASRMQRAKNKSDIKAALNIIPSSTSCKFYEAFTQERRAQHLFETHLYPRQPKTLAFGLVDRARMHTRRSGVVGYLVLGSVDSCLNSSKQNSDPIAPELRWRA